MLSERRRITRLNASRIGSLILPSSSDWKECLVWDQDELRAVIWLDFKLKLPSSLILSIASIRFARACRVVWSDGHIHGLEFIPNSRLPAAAQVLSGAPPGTLSMMSGRIRLPFRCEVGHL
ncbi:hypothetical protein FHU13_005349 [Methylobacterium sp. R2-1]|nr:hypothetical protein [Methylobacterium sp. R2-1]